MLVCEFRTNRALGKPVAHALRLVPELIDEALRRPVHAPLGVFQRLNRAAHEEAVVGALCLIEEVVRLKR